MNFKKTIILSALLSSVLSATVYSDAEEGTTEGWSVYDNTPAGAIVSNLFDNDKNSNVIDLKGEGRANAYLIGSRKGEKAWHNRKEKILQWSMNFSEKFRITVYVKTKKGERVFLYDYKNCDKGLHETKYIGIGLGDESTSGKWIDIRRNLKEDLKKYEPDNRLISVNGFKVQGSGRIDNLGLTKLKISNIHTERLKKDYTKIVWSLNRKATGQVEYGTTTAYGNFSKKEDSFKYKTHRQSLRGLKEGTTYHYRVISEDRTGNRIVSKDHRFTTKGAVVNNPPITLEKLKEMIANGEDVTKVNTSEITDMSWLFSRNKTFNQDISGWDVSNVTDMSSMFSDATSFNQPLENWDVSKVTDMSWMFHKARSFNQALSKWDVSNVTDMSYMFYEARSFNQPLEKWDVSKVTDMGGMFWHDLNFNQPLEKWNVSRVMDMSRMFSWNKRFNQDISGWDVSNVTNMEAMFGGARSFNQPLEKWDVSNVADMRFMFYEARSFNQSLAKWDVSNVTDMGGMFYETRSFSQPLEKWNVSNVTNMLGMFESAKSFNQPLEKWDVSKARDMRNMFNDSAMKPLPSWYKK